MYTQKSLKIDKKSKMFFKVPSITHYSYDKNQTQTVILPRGLFRDLTSSFYYKHLLNEIAKEMDANDINSLCADVPKNKVNVSSQLFIEQLQLILNDITKTYEKCNSLLNDNEPYLDIAFNATTYIFLSFNYLIQILSSIKNLNLIEFKRASKNDAI